MSYECLKGGDGNKSRIFVLSSHIGLTMLVAVCMYACICVCVCVCVCVRACAHRVEGRR